MANVLLDEVDKELERRGHCFARYADDCNVNVRSRKAGERVPGGVGGGGQIIWSPLSRLQFTDVRARNAMQLVVR